MKRIDYTHGGGFPLEQHVLAKMQSAAYDTLKAFVGYLNIPDAGNYVLSGCNIVGANITPGMLYIDGELCAFAGAVGTGETKIKKVILSESAAFENGNAIVVFFDSVAQINEAGTALSEFQRIYPVYDQNYVHTDNNLTAALLLKLNEIEARAEKNVQTVWSETNPLSDAYLVDKPVIPNILLQKSYYIGDLPFTDGAITVDHPPVVGEHFVIFSINANSDGSANNNYIFSWQNAFADNFTLLYKQLGSTTQSITIDYLLIAI